MRLILGILVAETLQFSQSFSPSIFRASLKKAATRNILHSTTVGDALTSAPTLTSSSSSSASSSTSSKLEKFRWEDQWYPVSWARDVPVKKPLKVTVFDVDYVITRMEDSTNDDTLIGAMLDECPHKKASLSEGRILDKTENCYFQCAYHGWTFDGSSGVCVDIPQVESRRTRDTTGNHPSDRSNGKAVPAMISQQMVWIFVGEGGLERALQVPPPPRIPQLDLEGFKILGEQVRDFYEVDWTLLVENVMDPDHGFFSHQFTFLDYYIASKDHPQIVEEKFVTTPTDGEPCINYKISSSVDAVEKMVVRNRQRSGKADVLAPKQEGKEKPIKPDVKPLRSVTTFHAPSSITMGQFNPISGKTNFLLAFWVSPMGTGKSRIMAASLTNLLPFKIPRWLSTPIILKYLDQDTFLLATQSRRTLNYEAHVAATYDSTLPLRKQFYVYLSPTEKVGMKIGSFFDSTLARVPGRLEALQRLRMSPELPPLTRQKVLDRYEQHTKICADSQGLVKKCKVIQYACGNLRWLPLILKVLLLNDTQPQFLKTCLVKANVAFWFISLSIIRRLAFKLEREFYFKYSVDYRERDMSRVPKVWADQVP